MAHWDLFQPNSTTEYYFDGIEWSINTNNKIEVKVLVSLTTNILRVMSFPEVIGNQIYPRKFSSIS